MTEVIHERSPRSRGRVRCDDCGRRIPNGEQYRRSTVVDGSMIWDWRECQPCEDAVSHVTKWKGPYSDDYYPNDFHDWAYEAMGDVGVSDSLFLFDTAGMWRHYLADLAKDAAACAADDADAAQAWGDEAWAAFTWRMQTSPVFNARRK
jgi:hypothetical protein|nr:MAG TPA: hypothetical protein [Caudoviricetes sp.]